MDGAGTPDGDAVLPPEPHPTRQRKIRGDKTLRKLDDAPFNLCPLSGTSCAKPMRIAHAHYSAANSRKWRYRQLRLSRTFKLRHYRPGLPLDTPRIIKGEGKAGARRHAWPSTLPQSKTARHPKILIPEILPAKSLESIFYQQPVCLLDFRKGRELKNTIRSEERRVGKECRSR